MSFTHTIRTGLTSGVHTITVQTINNEGPTGISVQLSVTRKCSDNPDVKTTREQPIGDPILNNLNARLRPERE